MYKCNIRIATEGGESSFERDRHKRDGDNFEKGQGMKLKLCPKCRVVWEHVASAAHKPAYTEYYASLPRYGKPIETCPRCEAKK